MDVARDTKKTNTMLARHSTKMSATKSETPGSTSETKAAANKMNMLLAKHSIKLSAFKRPTKPETPSVASDSKPAANANKTGAKKSGFSSLSTTKSNSPAATTTSSNPHANPDSDDGDEFGSLNAGVGYGLEGKTAAATESAATRDLRGRLLGKRAREQKEDAAAARRANKKGRRLGDESSDDEEGRSKIGKSRKGKEKRKVVNDEGSE